MMTGSSDTERDCRSRRSVSMPLMPGIITSSSTASTRLERPRACWLAALEVEEHGDADELKRVAIMAVVKLT